MTDVKPMCIVQSNELKKLKRLVMLKIRIYVGFVSVLFAIGSVSATKLNFKVDPEYYLTTSSQCVRLAAPTGCIQGPGGCIVTVSATQVNRPVYDDKTVVGICINPLSEVF